MSMKISAAGIAAIEQREGERLKEYPDSRNIPTIGVGHTPAYVGEVMTQAQVDATLASDLAWAEAAVNDSVVNVNLTQNEFDALVSVTFNIGAAGFKGSSIVKQLNTGNFAEAAKDFMMWDKPAVLVKRRQSEMAQFLSDGAGNTPAHAPDLTTYVGIAQALGSIGYGGKSFNEAVTSFQKWAGITADGLPGTQTQAALKAALASLKK